MGLAGHNSSGQPLQSAMDGSGSVNVCQSSKQTNKHVALRSKEVSHIEMSSNVCVCFWKSCIGRAGRRCTYEAHNYRDITRSLSLPNVLI